MEGLDEGPRLRELAVVEDPQLQGAVVGTHLAADATPEQHVGEPLGPTCVLELSDFCLNSRSDDQH